jgi:hypothetical protein
MSVTAMKPKNAVESLREIVQDLLVPELKAIKATMDGMRVEMQLRDEKQTDAIRHLDEKQTTAIKHVADNVQQLSVRIESTLDIRERLASVEARLPRN